MADNIRTIADAAGSMNNAMKNLEMEGFLEATIKEHEFLSKIERAVPGKFDFYGDHIVRVINTKKPDNADALPEGGDVPATLSHSYESMTEYMRYVYASTGWTAQALKRATGGRASFVNIQKQGIIDLRDNFKQALNRFALGDGSGRLARISAVTAQGVCTVDNGIATNETGITGVLIPGTKMLNEGQRISIYNAPGGTQKCTVQDAAGMYVGTITSSSQFTVVDSAGSAVDLTANTTAADNDYIFQYTSGAVANYHNKGPKGLAAWAGDATRGANYSANYQGLTRVDKTWLIPKLRDQSAADISLKVFDDASDAVKSGRGRGVIDDWYMSRPRWREICRLVKQDLQYFNKKVIIPDLEVPSYDGKGFVPLDDIADDNIFGLVYKEIEWAIGLEAELMVRHGDVVFPKPGSRADEYETWMRMWFNWWTDRCDNFVRIYNLSAAGTAA